MEEGSIQISLDALAAGDERAWNDAYQPLYNEIWKVVKARLQPGFGVDWNDLACEIIAAEIMPGLRSRKSRSFAKLDGFSDLLALARTIAVRRAVDVIRKVTRRGQRDLPVGWSETIAAKSDCGAADAGEGMENFLALVDRLKPPKPAIFIDHFVAGLTYAEIAEAHDLPLNTVCSHFYRGLKQLRDFLGGPGEADRTNGGLSAS